MHEKEALLEQLQRDMGLCDNPGQFETFQRVVAQMVLNLRWNRSKNAQQQDPKVLARLVWKVRDCLPFLQRYPGSDWPILFLLEIYLMSVQRKEARFRQRSDSQATLPDFPLVEISDAGSLTQWST
ncbi:hypothetical protein BKA70DRAFT_1225956 [Coprinopsis sp. MPI-PUGE-AT-0042]|nr:hypothetical protein BKA70DRAFT_1235307 [Coprinopsis sp. MPI-PUGE-AT-0042]KAH6905184.1 hypothetical protein BKA70DRAFT_1225956 [Coprinopsis sp. MPI-PUGE-AT-0042]